MTALLFSKISEELFKNDASTIGHIIGWIAGALSICAFLPQSLKVFKTRNTKGISLWMYVFYCCANCSWILWGIISVTNNIGTSNFNTSLFSNLTVILPNWIATLITLVIVYIKIINIIKYQEEKLIPTKIKSLIRPKIIMVMNRFNNKLIKKMVEKEYKELTKQ